MRPPKLEKGAATNDAPDSSPLSQKTAYPTVYRQDARTASHLVVYRLDAKDRPPESPELWEEAYEARVSLLAQEAAGVERENHYLRSRLAMAEDELAIRRKLCRCRRWTK